MPVASSIDWRPLRDSHYVVASLQPSSGGLQPIFVAQDVLRRILARAGGHHPDLYTAGLLIGQRLECPQTGTRYTLIESVAEPRGRLIGERSVIDAIERLVSQESADSLMGWYTSSRSDEIASLSRTHVAIHGASFHERWHTALILSADARNGGFFLFDPPAARWFLTPFYEVAAPTRRPQPAKTTAVAWPNYLTTEVVAELPVPAVSAPADAVIRRLSVVPADAPKSTRPPTRARTERAWSATASAAARRVAVVARAALSHEGARARAGAGVARRGASAVVRGVSALGRALGMTAASIGATLQTVGRRARAAVPVGWSWIGAHVVRPVATGTRSSLVRVAGSATAGATRARGSFARAMQSADRAGRAAAQATAGWKSDVARSLAPRPRARLAGPGQPSPVAALADRPPVPTPASPTAVPEPSTPVVLPAHAGIATPLSVRVTAGVDATAADRAVLPEDVAEAYADLEDTTASDHVYRYLALARREGFAVDAKYESVDADREETLWVLTDRDTGLLLTIVTRGIEVCDATLHYNTRTHDSVLPPLAAPPDYGDVESATLFARESCIEQLRARCRRLRAAGALEREWTVAPSIQLVLPAERASATGRLGGAYGTVGILPDLHRQRLAALPEPVRKQFRLTAS